jgi:enoyl-CoA hydratase
VIITGEGKAFVAGADIAEMVDKNSQEGEAFSRRGHHTFSSFGKISIPVIAAINGFALGGGLELAMGCDFRIASTKARFGQPEVNLGLIPGYGGTQRLTQLVGKGRAMELTMTGNSIDAKEALRIGLVNHVADTQEDMMSLAKKLLQKIMLKAPIAISMVINSINDAINNDKNGYQTEANAFASCCKTEDFKEGTAAFLEKRKPEFSGK